MAAAGDSVTLECRVEALPKPTIAFWKDPNGRDPVIDGPKYTIQLLADPEVNIICKLKSLNIIYLTQNHFFLKKSKFY